MESMQYSLLAGGKRLRPALVLETFKAAGGHDFARPAALAAAAAIELVHTFSLVHDDLPAMDDDDLRRGQPTNHKVFGPALAILAGDAMTFLAFDLLARRGRDRAAELIAELASAAGPEGMIGGQVLDIEGEHQSLSLNQLQRLHRMKTGALLRAAARMGAIAANTSQATLDALTAYGEHLGLAFQIVDDLLDVTATPEQMGKATKKDAARGKNTYPALIGLPAARQQAAEQLDLALQALAILAGDAMTLLAFDLLARKGRDHAADLIAELASAAGPEGMIGGQVLDIEGEHQSLSINQLQRLHRMKTGALLRAAPRMGAIAADASQATLDALTAYGEHLGLAFQIVDDLLDVTATPQQMGKATKKDAAKGKNTYPALIGLPTARQQAAEQLNLALRALAPLDDNANGLRALAAFVVERQR
jgi:geranylgeranyl diphosphate synthase type II